MRLLPSLRSSVHASFKPAPRSLWLRARYVSTTPQRRSSASSPDGPATAAQSRGKEKDLTQPATDAAVVQDELPLLQRPLGVKEKPKARVKTWSDTKEKCMDQDRRMEERTHLCVFCRFSRSSSQLIERVGVGRRKPCEGTSPT